jgi:hypothetical protein
MLDDMFDDPAVEAEADQVVHDAEKERDRERER